MGSGMGESGVRMSEWSALQEVDEHHRIFPFPVVVRIEQGESHFLVESDSWLLGIRHQEPATNMRGDILDDHSQREINQSLADPTTTKSAIDGQPGQLYGGQCSVAIGMSGIIDHIPTTNVDLTCDERDKPEQLSSRIARCPLGDVGFGDAVLMELLRLVLQEALQRLCRMVASLEARSRVGGVKRTNRIVFAENHFGSAGLSACR